MSILIKGMKMPKGCAVCSYCDRNWSKPKCHAKSAKGRYMSQKLFIYSRRQDWCPLVEVESAEPELMMLPVIDPVVHCAECRYAETFIVCGEPILTCDNNEGLFRDVPEDGYCYCGARMEESDETDRC